MKNFTTLFTLLAIFLAFSLNAQVAINNDGTDASTNSILHVKGTSSEALFIEAATGEVGLGTTTPSQKLDVRGNMRISGAIMPGNDAGTSGQLLISEGAGAAATWGAEMLNRSETSAIGKFYSGSFDLPNGYFTLTLTDPNCVETSTCSYTWVGDLPDISPQNYGNILSSYEAQDGQWIFHFRNITGYNFTNMEFSFIAFY